MKELANNILAQIEVDISEIDLYGYDIIETSLSMVHKLREKGKNGWEEESLDRG